MTFGPGDAASITVTLAPMRTSELQDGRAPLVRARNVKTRIAEAMHRAAEEQLRGIRVVVVGRQVWLTGTTTSATARVRAETAAWSVPGVDDVVNEICVVAP
jgi:osmotically-inducible protein OsmY